jgi:hypothetical protein
VYKRQGKRCGKKKVLWAFSVNATPKEKSRRKSLKSERRSSPNNPHEENIPYSPSFGRGDGWRFLDA